MAWSRADGATVRAARARAELAPDAAVTLEGVEVALGAVVARAPHAVGRGEGAWTLSGGVRVTALGSATDGGAADGAGDAAVPPRVEVEAARMRLDPRARRATLEGGVRVRRGDVEVESPRVVVAYGPAGDVAVAEADGPVVARWSGAELRTAGGARVDFARGTMALPGRVRVARDGFVVEGRGVTVDLATGAVELTDVRGWLPHGASPR